MNRNAIVGLLDGDEKETVFDFVIIGGGATGLGVCVDGATRGYKTALFERFDFTKGTSSRSTKLVHGGVRYLAQGDIALVREALRERGLLKKNAPHLVKDQVFLIPCYRWWELPFYTIGLTCYDILSGSLSFGRSKWISASEVEKRIPALKKGKVSGGVLYHDGQFDDSRLAIDLVKTANENGALVLNYAEVISLLKEDGKVAGVKVRDNETGKVYDVKARCVINAAGVFSNEIIRMDNPDEADFVKPSQGVHLVLDKSFLGGDHALMIPKTSDGRVLFAVPWHDKVVVGTTDTPMDASKIEPVALEKEISFILDTAGQYLAKQPKRSDVLSVFAGLRPLAAPKKETNKTKEISRSHKIIREKSGLITIIGGKWTTYRQMAEDTVNYALRYSDIPTKPCVTKDYKIQESSDVPSRLTVYGKSAKDVERLIASSPEMGEKLHPNYDYTKGEVVWIVRNEMPRNVEDVLARRFRALFLDARAAMEMAPAVADIMAAELGKDEQWKEKQIEEFKNVAANYVLN